MQTDYKIMMHFFNLLLKNAKFLFQKTFPSYPNIFYSEMHSFIRKNDNNYEYVHDIKS